ncbi:MAG: YciI family protein [Bdellovibrionota bacterium]
MKFLCIYKPAKAEGTPPTQNEMQEMGKLITEGLNSGWLLSTEGCLPSSLGARVRLSGGKFSVTDGPFTEAKEIVGGFALIQAKSKAEAIELTRNFLKIAGDGESEIRQVYEEAPNTAPGR